MAKQMQTRVRALMIGMCLGWPLACPESTRAKPPEPPELLGRMEQAAAKIDTYRATATTSVCPHFRAPIREQSAPGDKVALLEEADWPKPAKVTVMDFTASGDRFLRAGTERYQAQVPSTSAYLVRESIDKVAYNGKAATYYKVGSGRANRTAAYRWIAGELVEPRQLAYRSTTGTSRLDDLQGYARSGKMGISEASFEGRSVLVVEAPTGESAKLGYKIWVDPGRGFLPIRMEEYSRGKLIRRIVGIEHKNLNGVWFPVAGTLEQIEHQDPDNLGRVRAHVRLEVDPATVHLNPQLSPETFDLRLPPGTKVSDEVLRRTFVVAESNNEALDDQKAPAHRQQASAPASAPAGSK